MREEKEIHLNDWDDLLPSIFKATEAEAVLPEGRVVQFFIFRGEDYLGWDCFTRKRVSIGSGDDADLVLNGPNVPDIHAHVYFKDHQIIVSAQDPDHKVLVNGRPVDTHILGPLDYLSIGAYTLKIKLKHMTSQISDREVSIPKEHLPDIHRSKPDMDKDHSGIKGADEETIVEDLSVQEDNQDILVKEKTTSQTLDWMPEILEIIEVYDEDADEDDEEGDEDDTEGSFSLREKIINAEQTELPPGKENIVVEVVKFRQNNVIDVCFLHQKKRYYRRDGRRRFCLAEYKDPERCYFFFNDQCHGQFRINDTRNIALSRLSVPENIYRKRRRIYRYPLPRNGSVFLSYGCDEYLLRVVAQGESPQIPDPVKKENSFHRNLIKSSVFHILVLILGGLFISVRAPILSPTASDRPRFVKIDNGQIADSLKKIRKVPIKETEVNRPEKNRLKKQPISAHVNKRESSNKNSSPEGKISRSPHAGGGSGKAGGNVLNRNIKQAGILGALGMKDGAGIGVQEALASVTNLDAVPSSGQGEGGFKVAGIVGKVEGSRIEVPSAGMVNTKGSAQVLRSAGVEGQGDVAALEVGETGRNQVMAMVTADLSRKVLIQGGGMSREAVKRVIDQHLDEITYCYEAALISDPSIMGKIVFEWKILIEGTVGEVRINFSSIRSTEIHSCIKEKIKSWQFPKPHGREVIVSYPFIFDIVGF